MCAPCLANCGGGGLSRFSLLSGGWVFYVWEGEGCRLLVCCVVVSLVRAEAPVPSVATSGCPKRSEDGFPVGARGISIPQAKIYKIQGTQKSRRFLRISGIFCEVRPLGLEPRTH